MTRKKRSKADLEALRAQIQIKKKIIESENSILQKAYHKSPSFIIGLTLKIFYILFCIALIPLSTQSSHQTNEIFLEGHYNINTYTIGNSGGKSSTRYFEFKTDKNKYAVPCGNTYALPLQKGDTIIIEKNFLNKSTYLAKKGWSIKYNIPPKYMFYFMLGFLTIVALFFNDGTKKFDKMINVTFSIVIVLFLLGYLISN